MFPQTKYLIISREPLYRSEEIAFIIWFFKFREAQSTKIVMAIAVFLTYPLQMYPVVEIFLPALQRRFSDRWMVPVELAFRYFLVAITCKLSDFILSYNEYK